MIKIVFTGGPCAGKTKIINNIIPRLKELGFNIIFIDETARNLINDGIIPKKDYNYTLKFQDAILKIQNNKEMVHESFADSNTIVIYDRAIFDNRAYLENDDDFKKMLKENNIPYLNTLDKYDLVINLVSLSAYEIKNYKYEKDEERQENIEDAKLLDSKTSDAWVKHRNFRLILSKENIKEKEDIVFNHITNYLYGNRQITNTKFYEVDDFNLNKDSIKIEKDYIKDDTILIKRSYDNENSYIKRTMINLKIYDKIISEMEYNKILIQNDIYKNISYNQVKFIKDFNIYKLNIYNNYATLQITGDLNTKIPDNIKIKVK